MQVTHSIIDVGQHLARIPEIRPGHLEDLPSDVIAKMPQDVWLVSHDQIHMDQPIRWFQHVKGTHVVLPLFPYVLSPRPEEALGYMLQLGMRCSFDLGRPIKRLHLALGHPVNQFVGDPQLGDGWQFWAGFGLVLS